jgi:hypothetical protein
MILIASKVFLGLETIITTHKKQIGTCWKNEIDGINQNIVILQQIKIEMLQRTKWKWNIARWTKAL